jgi:hypothetical protein
VVQPERWEKECPNMEKIYRKSAAIFPIFAESPVAEKVANAQK